METLYWVVGIVAAILVLKYLVNKYVAYLERKEFNDMICGPECDCEDIVKVVTPVVVKTAKKVTKTRKPAKKVKK